MLLSRPFDMPRQPSPPVRGRWVPGRSLRVVLGEMCRELLHFSQRGVPGRLAATGFAFEHPGIEEALRDAFGPLAPHERACCTLERAGSARERDFR